MTNDDNRSSIIESIRSRIAGGGDWYRAFLSASAEWPLESEDVDGERFTYLLDGEALDLMRLSERFGAVVADLVPADELATLLANDRPPFDVSREEMKELMGAERYHAYLTFLYGVLVEEMVVLAVLEELRKRQRVSGRTQYDAELDDAYIYVYGSTRSALLLEFKKEKGLPRRRTLEMTTVKEFTYWLFKLRLRSSDKSRVASDTKRALTLLHRHMGVRGGRGF
jgi:hypothetical protein